MDLTSVLRVKQPLNNELEWTLVSKNWNGFLIFKMFMSKICCFDPRKSLKLSGKCLQEVSF